MISGRFSYLGEVKLDNLIPSLNSYSEDFKPEVLLVEDKKLTPTLYKKLQLQTPPPAVLVCYKKKFKYWKYFSEKNGKLMPFFWRIGGSKESLYLALQQAQKSFRDHARLHALRARQMEYASLGENPALHIISNLIRSISSAKKFSEIKSALLSLKGTVDFHDVGLYFRDNPVANQEISEGTHLIKSGERGTELIHSFTDSPWTSAILSRIDIPEKAADKVVGKIVYIVFYKRDLFPLDEKDLWILELTHGPLALALERVTILQKIERASKEWRATFDAIADPITVIDSQFTIQKANLAFAKLIKKDIKKIKGQKCHALLTGKRQPCQQCPALNRQHEPVKIKGRGDTNLLAWSFKVDTPSGAQSFQFYRNQEKEAAIKATLIQSEKLVALGKLVSAIAHEINNPLTAILALSQLMTHEESYSSDFRSDMKEIEDAALRSKKIVADLLGFTESKEMKKTEVAVKENIKTALLFCKSALKNIRLMEKYPKKEFFILGTPGQFQQIIFNLVSNAAGAMQPAGGSLYISLAEENNRILIKIRDTGPGIPPQKMQNLFIPFFTSKKEGTGLGLAIVKNLTNKLNGEISVTSESTGTEFLLSFERKS